MLDWTTSHGWAIGTALVRLRAACWPTRGCMPEPQGPTPYENLVQTLDVLMRHPNFVSTAAQAADLAQHAAAYSTPSPTPSSSAEPEPPVLPVATTQLTTVPSPTDTLSGTDVPTRCMARPAPRPSSVVKAEPGELLVLGTGLPFVHPLASVDMEFPEDPAPMEEPTFVTPEDDDL